jgi:hypothetical protein
LLLLSHRHELLSPEVAAVQDMNETVFARPARDVKLKQCRNSNDTTGECAGVAVVLGLNPGKAPTSQIKFYFLFCAVIPEIWKCSAWISLW